MGASDERVGKGCDATKAGGTKRVVSTGKKKKRQKS